MNRKPGRLLPANCGGIRLSLPPHTGSPGLPASFSLNFSTKAVIFYTNGSESRLYYLQKQGLRGAVPIRKACTAAGEAGGTEGDLPGRKSKMIRLYRSAVHPGQWIAYRQDLGWVVFPAKENGWEARRPARGIDPVHLRQVALLAAEDTGILQPDVELAEAV